MVDVNAFELHPDESVIEQMVKTRLDPKAKVNDPVNNPSHYTHYKGIAVIQLTEQMNFNRGNAVKYIARAGLKDQSKEIEDLEKAKWYIQREIDRLKEED